MTIETLSVNAMSEEYRGDVARKLARVDARIEQIGAELVALEETKAWLEGLLSAIDAGPTQTHTVPQPRRPHEDGPAAEPTADRAQEPASVAETTPATSVGHEAAQEDTAVGGPAPRRGRGGDRARPATAKKTRARKTGGRKPATGAAPSLPARVLGYLRAHPEPKKVDEITEGLFGANAAETNSKSVRRAVEALAGRGAVDKTKQSGAAFYQAEPDNGRDGAAPEADLAPAPGSSTDDAGAEPEPGSATEDKESVTSGGRTGVRADRTRITEVLAAASAPMSAREVSQKVTGDGWDPKDPQRFRSTLETLVSKGKVQRVTDGRTTHYRLPAGERA